MTKAGGGPSRSRWLRRIDDTLVAHTFPPLAEGVRAYVAPDLVWHLTGIGLARYNMVGRARFPAGQADARIGETLGPFHEAGVPYWWVVGPTDSPSDLPARLAAHGLRPHGDMPYLALDLARLEGVNPGPDLSVRWVATGPDLAAWMAVVAGCYGVPERWRAAVEDLFRPAVREQHPAYRLYLGRLGGEAVGSSVLALAGRTASIWFVGTLETARGRGVGAAMTVLPLLEARGAGCDLGVLGSTRAGEALYRRLGFVEYGRVQLFEGGPTAPPGE